MSTTLAAAKPKTFTAWADAVRKSATVPSEAEVQKVAQQFKVPLEAVQALRTEMLEKGSAKVDDAGNRSKGLRKEIQNAAPIGTPAVKGVGAAAALVMGAPVVEKALKKLPAHIDVPSAFMASAVPLKSSDPALDRVEHVSIRDGKNHHFDVLVGVPKDHGAEPSVTLQFYKRDGSLGAKGELNAELARSLLPLLDVVTSRPTHASDGPKMQAGAEVMRFVLEKAELTAQSAAKEDRSTQHAVIGDAAKAFDAGQRDGAEKTLADLVKTSPFSDVRARAGFILGDMMSRLGRVDEAVKQIVVAFPRLSQGGQVAAQELLARLLNGQREFPRAEQFAQGAIREGLALRQGGAQVDLGSAYFALGFAQKNQGKMGEAVASMQASLKERPQSTATALALAGYLSLAGRADEAKAMFAQIPVPPQTEFAFMDYHTNSAWFAGVSHDREGVLSSVGTALETAKRFNYAGLLQYFKTEPDLDWIRGDKAFEALLSRFSV